MSLRDLYGGISEIGKAVVHRFKDAEVLLANRRWRAAMYLAGYAVECCLKAKLMKKYDCDHMKDLGAELEKRGKLSEANDIYTHSLELLMRLTDRLQTLQTDAERWRQFSTINRWVPAWRYASSQSNEDDASDFLEATDAVVRWIDHNV